MSILKPTISVIIATYNRAHLIEGLIKNLEQQTFKDFEIILVNNGSTDHTAEVLKQYDEHDRIRLFHIPQNNGWTAGYNFAFEHIRGEWFALLGDDDKIAPESFEVMLKVVEEIDPSIDAVTANAIDISTGKLGGSGLDHDQYLPLEKIIKKTRGEFFGITKTSLLGDKRFNENLPGDSDTFYYKIDAIAKRYYIHKALKIWGTPDVVTESKQFRQLNIEVRVNEYCELLNEPFYWSVLLKYNLRQYIARCLRAMFFIKVGGKPEDFNRYQEMLSKVNLTSTQTMMAKGIQYISPGILHRLYRLMEHKNIFRFLSGIFIKRYSTLSN